MKKKNGFTLIEVLVTISLLAVVTVVIVLSTGNTNEKQKVKEWKNTVNRIFSAAQALIEKENNSITKVLYESGGFTVVDINDLVSTGLIAEENLYDSVNGERIADKGEGYQKIKIYLNENEAIDYEYPYEKGSKLTISPLRFYSIILNDQLDYMDGVFAYDINNNPISDANIEVTASKAVINKETKKVTFNQSGMITLTYSYDGNKYYRYYEVLVPEVEFPDEGEFTYTILANGYYELTAHGAPGAGGAKGGTAKGTRYFNKGDQLKVVVGGHSGTYGGGTGYSKGGDSSRILLNNAIVIAGGGGGGGASGTAGGTISTDASKGGAAPGCSKPAAGDGTSYSGGGGTETCSYSCNCHSSSYPCGGYSTCWTVCGTPGNYYGCSYPCQDTCSSTSCSTCTTINHGKGGLNFITGLTNTSTTIGSSSAGYVKIEYVGK